MVTNLEALCAAVRAGESFTYLPFWGHRPKGGRHAGPWVLSQWYPASFVAEGVRYATAEHWMMAEKARLFGDEAALERVLESDDPGAAKAAGRGVVGFDDAVWEDARFGIVVAGNELKFGQNGPLRRYLVSTAPAVLVEASPRDRIWGIGMGASNGAVREPERWRGLNLLGFALMVVREELAAR